MNSTITFPPTEPTLRLARPAEKWAATLAEERLRLQEDQEILRAREQNLREYESRLRLLQAEIEAGRATVASQASSPSRSTAPMIPRAATRVPFHEDPALHAAWEKLHRARELMDAEQKNLRDERIAIHEMEVQVRRREESVSLRETRVGEREVLITAATPPAFPVASEHTLSAVTRLTRAPFNMAMSVIRGMK